MAAKMAITLDSLKEFDDGRIMLSFQEGLRRVVDDMMNRPGDKSARSVTLTMKAKPVCDPNSGQCESAVVQFAIKESIPTRESKMYTLEVRKGGHLVASVNNPTDHRQSHIDDEIEKNARRDI